MAENSRHVLRQYADSVVGDRDLHAVRPLRDANVHMLVRAFGRFARVFRVPQEVHQDLQDLVLFDHDLRHFLKIALDAHPVAIERTHVHAQCIVDEARNGEPLRHPDQLRIALLHRHDLLDVIDVLAQRFEFLQGDLLIEQEVFRQLAEIEGQVLAAFIGRDERS